MSDKTKLVRLSRRLELEFDKLPNKRNWDPVGFPEFVRDAVREKLIQEERLEAARNTPPAEDDPSHSE